MDQRRKKMKAHIFEKNGLPNPLGMIMIILIIGLVCLVQCILTQPAHAQKKPDTEYIRTEPAKGFSNPTPVPYPGLQDIPD